jgi:hypothetical protein
MVDLILSCNLKVGIGVAPGSETPGLQTAETASGEEHQGRGLTDIASCLREGDLIV